MGFDGLKVPNIVNIVHFHYIIAVFIRGTHTATFRPSANINFFIANPHVPSSDDISIASFWCRFR